MADPQDRLRAHLKAAEAYARLSSCERAKVGAVLVRDDRVISIGYNGTVAGRDNTCEIHSYVPDPRQPANRAADTMISITKDEVVHAEMNAIAFAARHGAKVAGATLVTTLSPCFTCAKLLVQSGIVEVWFGEPYLDARGVAFLKECGVACERIEG